MLDKLIDLDKQVFVFLNGLGSDNFDSLWLSITKQVYWTPFFLFIFYLLQKKIGWKNFVFYLIFMTVLILLCDQTTNIFKEYFQRLRPCNNEEIKSIIRIVKTSDTYSFFSGHAANSMASTFFSFMILKKYYKHVYVLFLFPLIFAYSRIYLGLHFPSDILIGYLVGAIFGYLCFKIFLKYTFKN
jgi:undecaprenyl-diphosphatase